MKRSSLILVLALALLGSTAADGVTFINEHKLGYVFAQTDVSDIPELASYTNVLLVDILNENINEIIKVAQKNNLPIVATFRTKVRKNIEVHIDSIIQQYPNAILGVCWNTPYWDDNSQAGYNAVKQFGIWLKKKHPGLQYWASFVERPRGKPQEQKVPPEVDVININDYFNPTPQGLRNKCQENLPDWLEKAEGRPVILRWCNWDNADGLVYKTEPDTIEMCRKIAEEYKLAGVVFEHYGDSESDDRVITGIKNNFSLTRQIQEIAGQWSGQPPSENVTVKGINHLAADNEQCREVLIYGLYLDKVTEVQFNNLTIKQASFTRQDARKIVVKVPTHTEGEVVVKVTNPIGSFTFYENKARKLLADAKGYFKSRSRSGYTKCVSVCRRIIREYPDTRYSKFADKMLKKIPAKYLKESPN